MQVAASAHTHTYTLHPYATWFISIQKFPLCKISILFEHLSTIITISSIFFFLFAFSIRLFQLEYCLAFSSPRVYVRARSISVAPIACVRRANCRESVAICTWCVGPIDNVHVARMRSTRRRSVLKCHVPCAVRSLLKALNLKGLNEFQSHSPPQTLHVSQDLIKP